MKRMLLGIGLLLSGIIGFTGWCIAAALTVQPGAKGTVLGCQDGGDWIISLFFAGLAAAGLALSLAELQKKD